MSFAEKLKELRKSKGLSQKSLAEQIGKTARIISYYENEENGQALPKMEFVQLVSDFFNVPITYFDENTSGKTKQDILIEKLIDKSVDEEIKWLKLEKDLIEDVPEIYFICDDINKKSEITLNNNEHLTYLFEKNNIYYVLALDTIFGYALYVYKLEWLNDFELTVANFEYIVGTLLSRLYKIVESSLDMQNFKFLDDAICNLDLEDKKNTEHTYVTYDSDEVQF